MVPPFGSPHETCSRSTYRLGYGSVGPTRVRAAKDMRARHEQARAGVGAARCGGGIDAAVDLDRAALGEQLAQPLELRDRGLDERLAAPARVHRHAEHVVDVVG